MDCCRHGGSFRRSLTTTTKTIQTKDTIFETEMQCAQCVRDVGDGYLSSSPTTDLDWTTCKEFEGRTSAESW